MTEQDVLIEEPADELEPVNPYPWMRPARLLNLLRPGLRAATDADARRLRVLPSWLGALLLPAAAVLIPLAAAVGTATTGPFVQGDPYDPWTFLLYDVFTESVPFMLAGLAVGLISPSAGVLFVIAYAIGNTAATVVTGELEPPLPAMYGRFASFAVLWLLVVEIPMFGRQMVERMRGPGTPVGGRARALFVGAALTSAGILAWALSAGLLIGVVFWLTAPFGAGPTLRATNTLEVEAHLFVIPAVVLTLVLLGVRYRGARAPLASFEPGDPVESRTMRLVRRAVAVAMGFVVLSGTLHQVIDVVVLLGGLILARPVATAVLRATGLATSIARIPLPARLTLAAAASLAFSVAFLSVFYGVEISRWFYAIIAIVVSFMIFQIALVADDAASSLSASGRADDAEQPAVATVAGMLILGLVLAALVFPSAVFADAWGDLGDTAFFIATNGAVGAAVGAALLMGALLGDDKKAPPAKKPPINPYARRPGGPAPRPFGAPPPKAPPPQDDGWRWYNPSTWF